jgi:hypothetical protein
MILQNINRREKHSAKSTFPALLALCLLWFSGFDTLRKESWSEPEKILLTVFVLAATFCIVRYTKVSGNFFLAEIESTTSQINQSAHRIGEEANSLLSDQKSNSKKLLGGPSGKYAKELRSEILSELDQERSFLVSQIAELDLAVIRAKEDINLLRDREEVTRKRAVSAQRPLAQAEEQKNKVATLRQELEVECRTRQNDVDNSEQEIVKNKKVLSSLQSEIEQLKIRIENTQRRIQTYRSQ